LPRPLKRALAGILSESELRLLRAGVDAIGDICILQIPPELDARERDIAQAVLHQMPYVRAVFKQGGPISGEHRTRALVRLEGQGGTVTSHREHGCIFKVDAERAYFSPRLSTERWRVAGLVRPGEIVVNLFGGVGPFSILAAKRQPACTVYSIDINPVACELAAENVRLNKLTHRVTVLRGDARQLVPERLRGVATRVLMPLPERAREFWNVTLQALAPTGGVVHYYTHVRAPRGSDPIQLAAQELPPKARAEILGGRRVREVGPGWFEVGLDVAFREAVLT
jgi:tRNA (guanine37-N1)-methyltransferase